MTSKRNQTSPTGSPSLSDGFSKEQDRFLPIANVSRIMKKSLPANAKISKEAKETVKECVSEFISFITGEASDKCQREKRKTINGDDLLWAMTTLGFENYVGPLKVYLKKYRETEGDRNLAGREDEENQLSPTNNNVYGLTTELTQKVDGDISPPATDVHLPHGQHQVGLAGFNGGFYLLGGQGSGSAENLRFSGGVRYGENLMGGGFNI